ncbi:GDNF family receptor alpha-like isoform X2 [Lethenteron reissneri]|uniref:GDNF family receptor alpha-like isoform X2 n=1 Tax=Lethenteron reissneri TaxID=7753 RepID=UPI002AB64A53|nr:GDNF family receptor alpha-like isoform X2 [Lethenteron reissneri]
MSLPAALTLPAALALPAALTLPAALALPGRLALLFAALLVGETLSGNSDCLSQRLECDSDPSCGSVIAMLEYNCDPTASDRDPAADPVASAHRCREPHDCRATRAFAQLRWPRLTSCSCGGGEEGDGDRHGDPRACLRLRGLFTEACGPGQSGPGGDPGRPPRRCAPPWWRCRDEGPSCRAELAKVTRACGSRAERPCPRCQEAAAARRDERCRRAWEAARNASCLHPAPGGGGGGGGGGAAEVASALAAAPLGKAKDTAGKASAADASSGAAWKSSRLYQLQRGLSASCSQTVPLCLGDAPCNRRVVALARSCAAPCEPERCLAATRDFYHDMPYRVAERLLLCTCAASSSSSSSPSSSSSAAAATEEDEGEDAECRDVRAAFHQQACSSASPGLPATPPGCLDVLAACQADPLCSQRYANYVGKCAGASPYCTRDEACRRAYVATRGTVLQRACACGGGAAGDREACLLFYNALHNASHLVACDKFRLDGLEPVGNAVSAGSLDKLITASSSLGTA